jgi:hypothetical protein
MGYPSLNWRVPIFVSTLSGVVMDAGTLVCSACAGPVGTITATITTANVAVIICFVFISITSSCWVLALPESLKYTSSIRAGVKLHSGSATGQFPRPPQPFFS